MKVNEIMTRDPRTTTPDASLQDAARLMKQANVGLIPVVEGKGSNNLVGVITDRDIAIRVVADGRDATSTTVREAMSGSPSTCRHDDDVDDVMELMGKEQLRRVPIVDERGSLVGIVAQADIVLQANDDH
jgi:CBS domain-containing protein